MNVSTVVSNFRWKGLLILLTAMAFVVVLNSCSDDSVTNPAANANNPNAGSLTRMSQRDTDGDGIRDVVDSDDDNDGILDDDDIDDDNDGVLDEDEKDCDDDGTINDRDDDYVELKGTISSIGENSFVAYGFTVYVDEFTRYEREDGPPITFDDLVEGMFVEVEGILNEDNTISACEVEVEDHGDDHGEDDHGDDDHGDDHVSLDSLAVGDFVEVKAVADGAGGWLIHEISREWERSHFEYNGEVEAQAEGTLTLLGIDFAVGDGIRFEDETHSGRTLGDLAAGDYIELYASYDAATDSYTATRIRLEDHAEPFVQVEAEVFSVDAGAGHVVVGGVEFHR